MRSTTKLDTNLEDAVNAFQDYVGLKLHFTEDLVWKKDMRLKLKQEQLLKRKDAYVFLKFVEEVPDRNERQQRLISMFKYNPSAWSGSIFEEETLVRHKARMNVISAIKHVVRTDTDRLVMFMEERKINVRTLLLNDGQSPYIVQHGSDILGGVTDETLALIDRGFKFTKQETFDPLWEERSFMLHKYGYCIDVDGEFLKQQFNKLVEVNQA